MKPLYLQLRENNNPVAIKHFPKNDWKGLDMFTTGTFCGFINVYSCFRAWCKIIIKYNTNSIAEIISCYAPSHVDNNNTFEYIQFCEKIVRGPYIKSFEDLAKLFIAQAMFETKTEITMSEVNTYLEILSPEVYFPLEELLSN